MAKEFKSTNELIEILNSKGVSIKDENNVEITRYTKVIEESFRGEELLMYEEFGIELDSAVSFEIIEK